MPSKRTFDVTPSITERALRSGSVCKRPALSLRLDEPAIKVEVEETRDAKRVKQEEQIVATIKREEIVENEQVKVKVEVLEDVNSELILSDEELERKLKNLKEEIVQETLEVGKMTTSEMDGFDFQKKKVNPPNVFPSVSSEDILPSQPKNWDKIYNTIVDMRKLIVTPVDTMGCERMPDTITPGLSHDDSKLYRFQLLISLMLSSQTKDEVNYSAMVKLNSHFKKKGYPALCLESCLDASEAELDECIKQVGFHRRKASFIKKTCELVRDRFEGDIPKTIEEIVTFPGVGPKMGHLLLQNGWGINLGIGVDVHLHRLAQMWGWVPKSDKPETTRVALEEWLPRKYWGDVNPLLVGFGQTVCVPRALNCDVCTLAPSGLCKGVNRKLAKAEITEARLAKLSKQRGNLLKLVELRK